MFIHIRDIFINEALDYAIRSKAYTSNRHDFHQGGLNNKQQKMFEGKLGEKIFKEFLISNGLDFVEDQSPCDEADEYDFLINNLLIDVKTRTKSFHVRTLEMVEQFQNKPKNIYVSVYLHQNLREGEILGWFTSDDLLYKNRIENNGYLDNYVMYDDDLRPLEDLIPYIIS